MLVHRDRKQMGGGQTLGRMENECLKGMGFPFKGDENALKLDRGGGCITLRMY